ncbi:hypothetical protein [Streptomyces sp. NPDC060001]|uniref:hypothetical protein n=1 Tax=Streptomyces sp. NPDC060001 TaxID=3347032 RepID=UPI00368EB872
MTDRNSNKSSPLVLLSRPNWGYDVRICEGKGRRMASNGAPAEHERGDEHDEDRLTFKGEAWRVISAPVVVERDGDSDLVEVWVKRRG